ncbi:alpha/beta fold hydrolase [Embleya sp. MST-111070]
MVNSAAAPGAWALISRARAGDDSAYLGGLSGHRRLIVLDLRGTGRSAIPQDPSSYRCDRLVDDVEALREHLGLPRMDLLGHSAGTNIATQYAARHPEKVGKLALIGPSPRAVGVAITGETRREIAQLRKHEPWFPAAFAALQAITEGTGSDWEAVARFFWGRWDATTRKHQAAGRPSNQEAARLWPRPSSRKCSPTPRSWCSREQATTRGSTTPTDSWQPRRHSSADDPGPRPRSPTRTRTVQRLGFLLEARVQG